MPTLPIKRTTGIVRQFDLSGLIGHYLHIFAFHAVLELSPLAQVLGNAETVELTRYDISDYRCAVHISFFTLGRNAVSVGFW